jgi:hypothetical protein
MCLKLTKDSARLKKNLRRRKKPIICYKVLREGMVPPFFPEVGGKWYPGLNVSTRRAAKLSAEERKAQEIYEGFHLYLENPQITGPRPHRCPHLCPHLCPYPRPCPYLYPCPIVVHRCTVEPEDIVAVGAWNGKTCIVATKATLHGEVGRLYEPEEE